MRRVVGLALGVMMLISPAQAQTRQVCEPGVIVELSEHILANRADAGRFGMRRTGAAASYLRLHYADVPAGEMLAFWRDLALADRDREMVEARDMALALAVSRDGFDAGLRFFGADPADEAVDAGYALQRAMILHDAGERYYRLMADIADDPQYAEFNDHADQRFVQQVLLFVGQGDAFLGRLSENAEAAGHVKVAILLAAIMQNQARFDALAERYARHIRVGRMFARGELAFLRATWGPEAETYQSDLRGDRQDQFDVTRAVALGGAAEFLHGLGRFTDQTSALGRVARRQIAAVHAGDIDVYARPEEALLRQYADLADELSLLELNRAMGDTRWLPSNVRHFMEPGSRPIERMVTYASLGPVMAGATFPPRPVLLSAGAEWEAYEGFALALGRGELPAPAGTEEAILGFELLWRDGQYDEAIAYAHEWFEPRARLQAFADVSARMDGLCDAVLAFPARGYLYGGQEIYRFPPEPQR